MERRFQNAADEAKSNSTSDSVESQVQLRTRKPMHNSRLSDLRPYYSESFSLFPIRPCESTRVNEESEIGSVQ